MNPVVLRERISLIKVRLEEMPDGTYQEIAQDLMSVWADIQALSTRDCGEGWGKIPSVLYRVRIRYQPLDLHRIRWRQKIYTLATTAAEDPTRQWLDFTVCEKR